MTEPFENSIGWEMNSDFVENITMSFSLWAVVAKHAKKQNSQPQKLRLGADASAIHGRLGCSGCTPAEPYPPNRVNQHTELKWPNQPEKAVAAAAFIHDKHLTKISLYP
jgi:hypothetical protein